MSYLAGLLEEGWQSHDKFLLVDVLNAGGSHLWTQKGLNHALINKITQVFHDFLAGIEFVGLYLVRTFERKEADMEMKEY